MGNWLLLEREALSLDDVIKDINTILTETKGLKEGVKSTHKKKQTLQ